MAFARFMTPHSLRVFNAIHVAVDCLRFVTHKSSRNSSFVSLVHFVVTIKLHKYFTKMCCILKSGAGGNKH